MSSDKKSFYGKEVTDAIKEACTTLGVSQENLSIEVVETGSTGIFGLIRKKAHIRVEVKSVEAEDDSFFAMDELLSSGKKAREKRPKEPASSGKKPAAKKGVKELGQKTKRPAAKKSAKKEDPASTKSLPATSQKTAMQGSADSSKLQNAGKKQESEKGELTSADMTKDRGKGPRSGLQNNQATAESGIDEIVEVSDEGVALLQQELAGIVERMGYPAAIETARQGNTLNFTLRGEYEEELAGTDGKVVDSLQYLLRKIATRKLPERVRIGIDVGNFREKRLEELKIKAVELAGQVKEDGKTQVLPALNPQERREIHMVLQEDKEIRSRSVGDGLFKKILIYKPGKGKGGRKRGPRSGNQVKDKG